MPGEKLITMHGFGGNIFVIPKDCVMQKAEHDKEKKFKYMAKDGEILFKIDTAKEKIEVYLGSGAKKNQFNALTSYCLENGNNLKMEIMQCDYAFLREADKYITAYNLIVSA